MIKFVFNIIVVSLLFGSCCNNHEQSILSQSGKYIEGKVIIRAEKNHPIGLIKVKDVFNSDPYLESPSRAILYKYDVDGCENLVGLDSNVWFKVIVENGINFACISSDVKNNDDIITNRELYSLLEGFDINLHNSDPHREGPQHIRRHTRPNTRFQVMNSSGVVPNTFIYEFYDPNNVSAGSIKHIIYTTEVLTGDTDYFMYFYQKADDFTNIPSDVTSPSKVYIVSKTHDHNH